MPTSTPTLPVKPSSFEIFCFVFLAKDYDEVKPKVHS